MDARELSDARWEREWADAAERGLVSVRQAAEMMGVPPHMVRTWKQLGLIHEYGGGKGRPSLFDPEEVRTAPGRRRNLHVGWRGRALTNAERMAERRLTQGIPITLPQSSPYRMLAFSCRSCGQLVTCMDPRKSASRRYYPHECYIEKERERRRDPDDLARRWQATQEANAATREVADRNGYEWTGPELEIAAREDLTARQAAQMLGRTLFAVRTQRRLMRTDPRKDRLAGLPHG